MTQGTHGVAPMGMNRRLPMRAADRPGAFVQVHLQLALRGLPQAIRLATAALLR